MSTRSCRYLEGSLVQGPKTYILVYLYKSSMVLGMKPKDWISWYHFFCFILRDFTEVKKSSLWCRTPFLIYNHSRSFWISYPTKWTLWRVSQVVRQRMSNLYLISPTVILMVFTLVLYLNINDKVYTIEGQNNSIDFI